MPRPEDHESPPFNIVEASLEEHKHALDAGAVSSVELLVSYFNRIATYDICGGLNAFTVFNPAAFDEAAASDARRAAGLPARRLEGIPYTLKDSYKYQGLTVTNGSPALAGLMSSEDSAIAAKLRSAGAVLIGKTNMPPMAAGGMQRGLYGRAESPYNPKYLTAAFSSGSSNGAATSIASSMAVFGMGSETVSSGRSPASNNALVCYTPSKGLLPCRGLWPLYVTCDVPVPYARSMTDLFDILDVIAEPDGDTRGDFWREQPYVPMPPMHNKIEYRSLAHPTALEGKRIGVPKMYIGMKDSNPHAKHPATNPDVLALWETARNDLEALGAEIIYTDFPLVTNYENDSQSGQANNVSGAPEDWNHVERTTLISKAWSDFLAQNDDPKMKSLADLDALLLFPKPKEYLPDTFMEVRNWIDYAGLPTYEAQLKDISMMQMPGLEQALTSLAAQRKRDLDVWMDTLKLDCIAFPAQGDVGGSDLEFNIDSARHSLQNGVKYSHGNRAIRHLGVPTVSVPMGVMEGKEMPVNLTFAGKAYDDERLLGFAYAYEQGSRRRSTPGLTPGLETDIVIGGAQMRTATEGGGLKIETSARAETVGAKMKIHVTGAVTPTSSSSTPTSPTKIQIYVDGTKAWNDTPDNGKWEVELQHEPQRSQPVLGWDLKPLSSRPVMVLVVAEAQRSGTVAKLMWVEPE